jgi:hypothetical protein
MSDPQALPSEPNPPCDFLAFIAQRWNTDIGGASDRLGQLLMSYEPGPLARKSAAQAQSAEQPKTSRASTRKAPPRAATRNLPAAEPTDAAA